MVSVVELKGISDILAAKSSTEKSHIDSENKSIKDNQYLATLFLIGEIVHTVVELTTENYSDIRHASLVFANKFQCLLLALLTGVSYSVVPIINCHSHLRVKR